MSVGFILLVHTALDRVTEIIQHYSANDCPVVVHVDKRVSESAFKTFQSSVQGLENVVFSNRHACDWGKWSLVGATLDASEMMLKQFPDIGHVYLASGSCLPVRPLSDLKRFLKKNSATNFIESVTTEDVTWTIGGLDHERFTLRFPFSWKNQRRLFDGYVKLQRRVKFKRKIPNGLNPHMGSQWWCLKRETLEKIITDPDRPKFDRYFKRVWIPDESYFQSLVRRHSNDIESRSLTLSKFDFEGKPHIFYDDHLPLLRRSNCFMVRKIWPQADLLYKTFLSDGLEESDNITLNTGKIDRVFAKAALRRSRGRAGLYMQSCMPGYGKEYAKTAGPYAVFSGFSDLYSNFNDWLSQNVKGRVHGHLYAPDGAEFDRQAPHFAGALSQHPKLRDYNPCGFLTAMLWSTRGEMQLFHYGTNDTQAINWLIATDIHAHINIVSGAWLIPLYHSDLDFKEKKRQAARLQKIELSFLEIMQSPHVKARIKIWPLAEFMDKPEENLQHIIAGLNQNDMRRLTDFPILNDMTGFHAFLQDLKNGGMHPNVVGDFITPETPQIKTPQKKPYIIK